MDYTKLSDKQLKLIIETLKNNFESERVDFNSDEDAFEYDSLSVMDSTLKYFGFEPYDEKDYSFFIALCRLNEDTEGSIKRPKLETYDVIHSEEVVEYKTIDYSTAIHSYLPLTNSLVYSLSSNDLYLYYEGTVINEDTNDTEHRDDYVDKIIKRKRFD